MDTAATLSTDQTTPELRNRKIMLCQEFWSHLNQRRPRKYRAPEPASGPPRSPAPRRRTAPWDPAMVEHVRMVASLIEGRPVSRRQVRAMLQKVLRQHTMCRRRKIDQTVAWLNEQPP